MPIKIVVPQLGESVAEGTVSKWLKAVGDRVRREEPLVEIQTDKINVEIPSPAEGTLEKILIQEGTTVLVGTEIAQLSGAGEASESGVAGRVTRDDLMQYLQSRTAGAARPAAAATFAPAAAPAAAPAPPAFLAARMAPAAGGPREEVVPFSKVRKLIAENMLRAKHTA